MKLITAAAVALSAAPALAGGTSFIVDVSARNTIGLNRFLVSAGTWEFRVIGPSQGGQYEAYNASGGDVFGCAFTGCSCDAGWETSFFVDFLGTFDGSPLFTNGGPVCNTPLSALNSASNLRIVVTGPTPIFIKHTDDSPSNNQGGVSILVTRITDCLADVNNDGVSSPADFTAWLSCFNDPGSAVFCPSADVNGDGNLDPADFTAWLAAFQAGCP